MIAFFLGRQPEIGLAELEAVFQRQPQLVASNIALLDVDQQLVQQWAPRLGSIIKISQLLTNHFAISPDSLAALANNLFTNVKGKITLGVSIYDDRASKKSAINLGLALQSTIKQSGHSVRLLPTTSAQLSSAAVLHNKLAHGNCKKLELNFIAVRQGYLVTKTTYVQDIDSYTFRDRSRPCRDARNGMLPPKLAQTMINLALGACRQRDVLDLALLDPFCGTGVVLQEAALAGMAVYGTDLNSAMIDNTRQNLDWLARTHHLSINYRLSPGDAAIFNWQSWLAPNKLNLVVSETYLGKPYTRPPHFNELKTNIANCNVIIDKFFANLAPQLTSGVGICLGVPAWFIGDHINHLPCIDHLERYGYINQSSGINLIYHRPNQIVGRELLVLQKR